jgi:hypothetical protein
MPCIVGQLAAGVRERINGLKQDVRNGGGFTAAER